MAITYLRRSIGRSSLPYQQIASLMGFHDQRDQIAVALYWRTRR